jgi:hypothetical protein
MSKERYFSDPRQWCCPLRPSVAWVERYAVACRNYALSKVQQKHPEIAYHIISSNVFNYLLNTMDPAFPGFRAHKHEITNALTAAIAIVENPAFHH